MPEGFHNGIMNQGLIDEGYPLNQTQAWPSQDWVSVGQFEPIDHYHEHWKYSPAAFPTADLDRTWNPLTSAAPLAPRTTAPKINENLHMGQHAIPPTANEDFLPSGALSIGSHEIADLGPRELNASQLEVGDMTDVIPFNLDLDPLSWNVGIQPTRDVYLESKGGLSGPSWPENTATFGQRTRDLQPTAANIDVYGQSYWTFFV